MVERPFTNAFLSMAFLAPEGDQMFVRHYLQEHHDDIFQRGADGIWIKLAALPTTLIGAELIFSVPTRRPNRRYLAANGTARTLREFVEDAPNQWRQTATPHAYSDLIMDDNTSILRMSLSPDGLRLVFAPYPLRFGVFYTDRDSV